MNNLILGDYNLISTLLLLSMFTFPSVSISMGSVESNLNPYAVGDSGRSRGAFQVQGSHWGKVPLSFLSQSKQHNGILLTLFQRTGNLAKAVVAYNGQGPDARCYLKLVTRRVLEFELLGGV